MPHTAEELFVATLDAAEEYTALQRSLGEALRAGFLSLAQARYSMGADRVSALQYPAHMAATARLRTSARLREAGELELEVLDLAAVSASLQPSPASSGGGSTEPRAAAQAVAAGGDGVQAASDDTKPAAASGAAAAAEAEPLEQQLQRLRLAAEQNDGIMQQLAAKYGCGNAEGAASPAPGGDDSEYAEVAKPGRPLHWFGSLVAPSLRDAEGHFGQALALAVQAANTRARLLRGLGDYQAAREARRAPGPVQPPLLAA